MFKLALIWPFSMLRHFFISDNCILTIGLCLRLLRTKDKKLSKFLSWVTSTQQPMFNKRLCGATLVADLLTKLCQHFQIFLAYNISIQLLKTYFNYPDISLLRQRVNSLGFLTIEDKLEVIKLLSYPQIFVILKYYLGLLVYL